MSSRKNKVAVKSKKEIINSFVKSFETAQALKLQKQQQQQYQKLANTNNIKCPRPNCTSVINKAHFGRHLKEVHHKNPDIFVCEYSNCKEIYYSRDCYNRHKNSKHLEKKFACDVCNRYFKDTTLLSKHRRFLKLENIHLRRCTRCCQRFISITKYKKHISKDCGGKLQPVS